MRRWSLVREPVLGLAVLLQADGSVVIIVLSSVHADGPEAGVHGALRVSGHGVTLTLPHGWLNVPTTPDKLAQFIRARAGQFPHLRAALKSEIESVQNLRNVAVVAYHAGHSGLVTATLYVYVAPAAIPPRVLMPHVKGFVAQVGGTDQRDVLTTFGKYRAVVTYMLPGQAGGPADHAAVAFVHGPSSTPVITVKTHAADSIATLRRIVDSIRFQLKLGKQMNHLPAEFRWIPARPGGTRRGPGNGISAVVR